MDPKQLDYETERKGVKGILMLVLLRLWAKCIHFLLCLEVSVQVKHLVGAYLWFFNDIAFLLTYT